MAIDDGNGFAALARANTEVSETPVRLGFAEVLDDPALMDFHLIGKHHRRVMSVGGVPLASRNAPGELNVGAGAEGSACSALGA